jgi:hypothetical protein
LSFGPELAAAQRGRIIGAVGRPEHVDDVPMLELDDELGSHRDLPFEAAKKVNTMRSF